MEYERLIETIFKQIPEIEKEYLEKKEEYSVDEETGVHIIFGFIIMPYVIRLINKKESNDDILLNKIFTFFEQMAIQGDTKVKEVLDFTIIEDILEAEDEVREGAYEYMQVVTRMHFEEVRRYFKV